MPQKVGVCAASTQITFAVPFWILNQTGRCIRYRQHGEQTYEPSGRSHSASQITPELYSIDANSSKRVRFSLETGDGWSDAQQLDTVGHSFSVTIPIDSHRSTDIIVSVSLAQGNLTKIVTLMPRYILHNQSNHEVFCAEATVPLFADNTPKDERVLSIPPNTSVPFWPEMKDARIRIL